MTNHKELQTIRDFIRFATSRFNEAGIYYGHGTDNAWDEAVALTLHTLHLRHDINPAILAANLIQEERVKLLDLINQRVTQRTPVPYLTHEAWFANLPFYVDERVLIPRSPMAELIENNFQPWIENVNDILDLCTGSACIAIASAKAFPEARIDASDISPEALQVAKINVLRHAVEDQIHLYESDLFTAIPQKKYDIIISNPPYVSVEEMQTLPIEYSHEPKMGLEAGKQGLDVVMHILKNAGYFLKPQGILVVEVGNSEIALIENFPDVPFTWLEFECGGDGVFLLTAEQIKTYEKRFIEF